MIQERETFPAEFRPEDKRLWELLPHEKLTSGINFGSLKTSALVESSCAHYPEEDYTFLHECAAIEWKGTIFAAWYNNPRVELQGRTPIRECRSRDGGKTWSEVRVIADDPTGKILYCPPVFGICDGSLYLFLNEMVSADHIHALDLYRFDETADAFVKLWSRPIGFKLNTNVISLPNGKRMLAGRIAELDGFPNTPAVLISDSGKIDAEWRLVKIAENGNLPDGSAYEHPETCPIVYGSEVLMFCRDDRRRVPIVYRSHDFGETWSGPIAIDVPFSSSKIYAGTLSNGRSYVIGNLQPDRTRLMLLLTEPGERIFTKGLLIQDGASAALGYGGQQWSYPVSFESDGKLCMLYSGVVREGSPKYTAATFSALPIDV